MMTDTGREIVIAQQPAVCNVLVVSPTYGAVRHLQSHRSICHGFALALSQELGLPIREVTLSAGDAVKLLMQ